MTLVLCATLGLLAGLAGGYLIGERAGRNTADELVEALEHALTLARAGKTGKPFITAWGKACALFGRDERV